MILRALPLKKLCSKELKISPKRPNILEKYFQKSFFFSNWVQKKLKKLKKILQRIIEFNLLNLKGEP